MLLSPLGQDKVLCHWEFIIIITFWRVVSTKHGHFFVSEPVHRHGMWMCASFFVCSACIISLHRKPSSYSCCMIILCLLTFILFFDLKKKCNWSSRSVFTSVYAQILSTQCVSEGAFCDWFAYCVSSKISILKSRCLPLFSISVVNDQDFKCAFDFERCQLNWLVFLLPATWGKSRGCDTCTLSCSRWLTMYWAPPAFNEL